MAAVVEHPHFRPWLATLPVTVAAKVVRHLREKSVAMKRPSKDEAELGAWSTQVAPDGWVRDQQCSHPDPAFTGQLAKARRQTEAAHAIVTSLAELRRAVGLSQTELAERWGHTQSFVSRVERDVTNVEMATLVGYVRALGGRLTVTVEAGDRVFYEDLVVGL